MRSNFGNRTRRVVLALAATGIVSGARADLSPIVFEVQASSVLGSGTFQVTLDQTSYDPGTGKYEWRLRAPSVITDSATQVPIATLVTASAVYVEDPIVNLSFTVEAGGTDTIFTVGSGLLSFPAIDPAVGRASAGMTITDTDGDGASASGLEGLQGSMPLYLAQYNGEVPDGTTFAALIPSLSAAPGTSNAVSDSFPGGGAFTGIDDPVSDMSARFGFTLSANDLVSGTSHFEIIPEPATLLVLGGLGLTTARRRRRGAAQPASGTANQSR